MLPAQRVSQEKGGDGRLGEWIFFLFIVSQDLAVGGDRFRSVTGGRQQMRIFQGDQAVAGIAGVHAPHQPQRLVVELLPAQEQRQRNLRIRAGQGARARHLSQHIQPLLLVTADADNRGRNPYRPTQAADHVVVNPDHHLGINVVGVQVQNPLMVPAGGDCSPQPAEPGLFAHAHVGAEQGAGNTPGVKGVDIVRILGE